MNEAIIHLHNSVVSPEDTWICLGDVAFGKSELLPPLISRMNGKKKILVLGNHDNPGRMAEFFDEIVLEKKYKKSGLILTHMPVHDSAFYLDYRMNCHGHIHEKPDVSPRHLNISMERVNYTPIALDEVISRLEEKAKET